MIHYHPSNLICSWLLRTWTGIEPYDMRIIWERVRQIIRWMVASKQTTSYLKPLRVLGLGMEGGGETVCSVLQIQPRWTAKKLPWR